MNKRDFCYGALNQILVMTDYLEDQKSNRAGFVKYQTIKGLKAIRCCLAPNLHYRYLKLHGKERRSKEGFVVTNWEWNSGPSA